MVIETFPRAPLGTNRCEGCGSISPLYDLHPCCRDCGDAFCAVCRDGALDDSEIEGFTTVCLSCKADRDDDAGNAAELADLADPARATCSACRTRFDCNPEMDRPRTVLCATCEDLAYESARDIALNI